MPISKIEIHTFLVQPTFKERSQIIITLTPWSRNREAPERIFLLAEIDLPDINLKNQFQIFLSRLIKQYQEGREFSPATAFESALEWANQQIQENFDSNLWPHFHILFGLLKKDDLLFGLGGRLTANIFFKEKEAYKTLDLRQTHAEAKENPLFFPNLISGALHPNNFALFTTESVFDFLTPDRLQKIVTGQRPEEACGHLEKILGEIENKMAFGGLLVSFPENFKAFAPAAASSRFPPRDSIKQLISQENKTAEILSPALWTTLKKAWREITNKSSLAQTKQKDREMLKKITRIYNRLTGWQGKIKKTAQALLVALGKIIYKIYLGGKKLRFSKSSWTGASFKKQSEAVWLAGRKKLQDIFYSLKKRFLSWPPKQRYIFLGATAATLLLITSLTANFLNNRAKLESQNYNQ
ncbi:MAG: hypothetical protein HY982_00755 [Candidatus Magasanikbacteria bacterium]|nr:hypothetical protein [Candidatus Magasanikbacteria bacterium]